LKAYAAHESPLNVSTSQTQVFQQWRTCQIKTKMRSVRQQVDQRAGQLSLLHA